MSLPGWKPLERCTALCNRAEFEAGEEDKPILKREVHGDASEAALLKCAELSLKDVMAFRAKHKKVAEIPFNSVNKYQVWKFQFLTFLSCQFSCPMDRQMCNSIVVSKKTCFP